MSGFTSTGSRDPVRLPGEHPTLIWVCPPLTSSRASESRVYWLSLEQCSERQVFADASGGDTELGSQKLALPTPGESSFTPFLVCGRELAQRCVARVSARKLLPDTSAGLVPSQASRFVSCGTLSFSLFLQMCTFLAVCDLETTCKPTTQNA